MADPETSTAHVGSRNNSGPSSRPLSEADTPQDNRSQKSKDDHDAEEEAEEDIEESFQPGRDEEEGPEQHSSYDEKQESNIVDWDGPNDPENPHNWSKARKWTITMITAALTFVISFGSSVFSATTTVLAEQYGVAQIVMILGVTVYVCGFACGPLVWGPLSELYGRRNPLMVGMIGFVVFQIPVAVAQNIQTIMVFRFFGGAFGSAPLAIVAGMYVDFWDPVMRGVATMGYAGAVFAGPCLGPIVGEFTVKNSSLGWRWTLWFTMVSHSHLSSIILC